MNTYKKKTIPFLYYFGFAIFILVCFFCDSDVSFAAEGQDEDAQTIRVAFPEQEGVSEIDGNGNYSGYTYEYLQRVAQFTNWKYEFITFPDMSEDDAIMKSMEMVQNGEAEIMGCMLKLDGMTDMYDYPEQGYGAVYTTLSVLENNADITETNFMLKEPLRIAVLEEAQTRREELRQYFDSIGASYEEVLCKDMEEQTQALIDKKADALLRISLSFVKGTRQIAQFAPRPYYLVTTKGNTEIVDKLDAAIKQVNENYPYFQTKLFQKYFGDSSGGFLLTEKDKNFIKKHTTIQALYMTNNAPYSEEKNGKPSGILVSILNDFASAIHAKVVYTPVSSLEELKEKKDSTVSYDCVLGTLFCMDSTTQYGMVTTNTVFSSEVKQYCKRAASSKPIKESVVALHKRCGLQEELKDAKEIRWYDNVEECIKAVNRGECDTGFADSYSIEYAMDKNNILCSTLPFYGKEENIQIYMLNTGNLHYLSIFNRYINNLNDSEIYTYIANGSRVSYHNGIGYFIRSNPMAAGAFLLFLLLLILFCLVMSVFAGKLRMVNTQLRIANSAKSDFLSRVSHDMRTPLNGILGLLHLMKEKPECGSLKEDLKQMEMSGKYLLDLINDTLDVEKIERGHLELHPVVYKGEDIVHNLTNLLKPDLEKKHIQLHFQMENTGVTTFYIDVGRFEQVFMNLIGNSIKFTPNFGTIDVKVETIKKEKNVLTDRITIRDNGIGMSEEFLLHLFEPFSQENNTTTSQYKGTGLGMTICKQIIELMQGEIHVKSILGEGTEFVFTVQLPLATEAQIAQAALSGEELDLSVLDQKRILLFEDHPLNAKIARRLLEKKGMKVDHVENGVQGLALLKQAGEKQYDAILMDIRMPVMDGMEATREIRKLGGYGASIPIIAMTANAFEEDVKRCKEAGMNDHLSKPIDPKKLYQALVVSIMTPIVTK